MITPPHVRVRPDRPHQDALARAARAHVLRCAELLGAAVRWTVPHLAALEQLSLQWPPARAEWEAAEALWWRLALTERRVAVGTALRFRMRAPMDDLIQEGWIGLLRAAMRFDPDRGIAFRTVAKWWARAQITRSIDENENVVRPTSQAIYVASEARKWIEEIERRGETPTVERVRSELGRGASVYDAALAATHPPVSLERPLSGDEGPTLHEVLAADGPNPDADIAAAESVAALRAAVATLPPRQRRIVELTMEGATKAQIGGALGVSPETVRTDRTKAWTHLRAELGGRAG